MSINVDFEKLVSQGDIHLDGPVNRSEAGMPIGNGVTGSLAWTSPQSLKFQMNRVDVFANSSATHSFPERNTDYACVCGYVDIDFPGFSKDVFTKEMKQHLSIYDGTLTLTGNDVTCTVFAWRQADIMIVHVEDRRTDASGGIVRLRMMRPPFVRTRSHTAESALIDRTKEGEGIILTQDFKEDEYICSSAVAVEVKGKACRSVELSERELALYLEPGKGDYEIVIGTAASFAESAQSLSKVISAMKIASAERYENIIEQNRNWWHEYWTQGYIQLSSKDGKAELVSLHYSYFLYLMASCSWGGDFPPNYGGLIWSTKGDLRAWGAQFWLNNMNNYYQHILPSNRPELMDPYFSMFFKMIPSLEVAARTQWGSKGIFVPETTWFDGLEELPDDLADEMKDLYLLKKPWYERSQKFLRFAELKSPQNGRWNWKFYGRYVNGKWEYDERGHGPFGRVLHLFASSGRLAYQYWLRYEFTQDKKWLKEIGYPMIKGSAEFFRHYPNFHKGPDGQYHIYLINNQESQWGSTDTMSMMVVLKLVFPAAIRASEELGIDDELRAAWQEISDNLAQLPISNHPHAMFPSAPGEAPFWITGLKPTYTKGSGPQSGPVTTDLCSLETKEIDPEMFEISSHSYEMTHPEKVKMGDYTSHVPSLSQECAHLGKPDMVKIALYNVALYKMAPRKPGPPTKNEIRYRGEPDAMANRMSLVEGFNAIDAQRLGYLCAGLHSSLLQDNPGKPGLPPVIRLFPAWPDDWDADYKLLARGGFLVTASIRGGEIAEAELLSQNGCTCRIRNPWPGKRITVSVNGTIVNKTEEDLIVIDTAEGDVIGLVI